MKNSNGIAPGSPASCTLIFNLQHALSFTLILYWNQNLPSGIGSKVYVRTGGPDFRVHDGTEAGTSFLPKTAICEFSS
jgi:hypothetical protein